MKLGRGRLVVSCEPFHCNIERNCIDDEPSRCADCDELLGGR